MGADIFLNFHVKNFVLHKSKKNTKESIIIVNSQSKELFCRYVVTCGGLHSDNLSSLTGCKLEPKIIPFRGEYLVLKPEKSHLVKTNIYPVPHPDLPFLGVHFTPRMDGSVWLGPNAVLAFKKEGYKMLDFDLMEFFSFMSYSGLQKLMFQHFMHGLSEMYRSINIDAQVQILRKYIPELQTSDVVRGPAGVRAQALSSDGKLVDDFIFDESKEFDFKILHVRNAPSPAATSSLAIAKVIVNKMEEKINL